MLHILLTLALLVDPANLDPQWIEGIEKSDQIESEIDETIESLNQLEIDEALEPTRARIESNLEALPAAIEETTPPAPAPTDTQNAYTLEEVLNLGQGLFSLEEQIEQEKRNLSALENRIKTNQRYLDSLFVRYRADNGVDLGLEIMAGQSALALREQALRLQKERVARDQERARALLEELRVASKRLDLSDWNEEALESREEQSKRRLSQARAAEMADLEGDEATRASAATGLAQSELLESEMTLFLFRFANGESTYNQEVAREQIGKWQEEIDNLRARLDIWEGEGLDDPRLKEQLFLNQLLLAQVQEEVVAKSVPAMRLFSRLAVETKQLWRQSSKWLTYPLFHVHGLPFTLLSFFRIILILVGAWITSRLMRAWLTHLEKREEGLRRANLYALKRLTHYTIIIAGMVFALVSVGINLDKLALIAGALSVGIGFGLQSVANNFISGLTLLFERNVKIGDYIELETGEYARVKAINLQHSSIRTFDGVDMILPNSELTSKRLINWTMQDAYRRVRIPFGVAYGSDKEIVRQAAIEAAMRLDSTISKGKKYPAPTVRLIGFGESSLDFELLVWINLRASKRYGATRAAYYWELETALREHGITIPYPQCDVHLSSSRKEDLSSPFETAEHDEE